MKVKNKKDIGWVYILKGNLNDGAPVYKYGCTRSSVLNRKRSCNVRYKAKFEILASFPVKFPFQVECRFKWWMWGKSITGELLCALTINEDEMLQKMQGIASEKKYYRVQK